MNEFENIFNRFLRMFNMSIYIGTPLPVRRLTYEKTIGFFTLFEKIRDIKGDVVECGVGKGGTFAVLAYLASKQKRHLHGFDSFKGFPAPSKYDSSSRNAREGEWEYLRSKDALRVLFSTGFSVEKVRKDITIIPGFFKDTLRMYSGKDIALLHADVDLYNSYKEVLDYFYPYMVTGGIIVFDEYKTEKWPGATKAIDEFLASTGLALQYEENMGRHYVVT